MKIKTYADKNMNGRSTFWRKSASPDAFQAGPLLHRRQVRHILRGPALQPKLMIGAPNDVFEQEADRVADQVMRMPYPAVQHQMGTEEEENLIQTKPLADQISPLLQRQTELVEEEHLQSASNNTTATAVSPDIESKISSLKGGGQPLSDNERNFFEPRFGYDLSSVRVHTDAGAEETARSLNARAYTSGRDIAFGRGEYSPHTLGGRKLLSHELTHVLQQNEATSIRPSVNRQERMPLSWKVIQKQENRECSEVRQSVFEQQLGRLRKESPLWALEIIRGHNAGCQVNPDDLTKSEEIIRTGDRIFKNIASLWQHIPPDESYYPSSVIHRAISPLAQQLEEGWNAIRIWTAPLWILKDVLGLLGAGTISWTEILTARVKSQLELATEVGFFILEEVGSELVTHYKEPLWELLLERHQSTDVNELGEILKEQHQCFRDPVQLRRLMNQQGIKGPIGLVDVLTEIAVGMRNWVRSRRRSSTGTTISPPPFSTTPVRVPIGPPLQH